LTEGAINFAPNAAHIDRSQPGGLSNDDFFKRYAKDLLVFNGLDYDSYSVNNHAPCSRYMATGKLDSLTYPTFAAVTRCRSASPCCSSPCKAIFAEAMKIGLTVRFR
jgi:hypothetical protein